MLIERMGTAAVFPGHVDKLRDIQIAMRKTWAGVPDIDLEDAARHVIHVHPAGSTTITEMNSLDPATMDEMGGEGTEGRGWWDPPHDYGSLAHHGRVMR